MKKVLGVTGNREHKIPENLHSILFNKLDKLFEAFKQQGGETIISGGASGVDYWCSQLALKHNLQLFLYLPYKNFNNKQNSRMLKNVEKIFYVQDKYSPQSFFIRNQKIVDDCDLLVSVFKEGEVKGGSLYTHNYALKLEKKIIHYSFNENNNIKREIFNIDK